MFKLFKKKEKSNFESYKSSMEIWAENEIKIACERENPNRNKDEWDYGCACYEGAFEAFKTLLGQGHSGYSIGITKYILNRLIDGKPLTPIEDIPESWDICGLYKDGREMYQCKRMRSLYKYIYPDGIVEYMDADRVVCQDIHGGVKYSDKHLRELVLKMYPIDFPYMPTDNPFRIYTEDFLAYDKNGDFDTVGALYLIKPNGERVEVNRYFAYDDGYNIQEIDKDEYERRRQLAKDLLKEKENDST